MRSWTGSALVALFVLGSGPGLAQESCLTCHPDVRTEYEQSVHAKVSGCTGCHGGDPTTVSEAAHAVEKGYIGKPARKDIPSLCATCHADVARMRQSGLPTDQYARYQQSIHGQRLAAGDTRVAVCTDCHGVHQILARTAPTSPVAPRNIPATCARCHANAPLMAEYGLPADQLEKFRSSVHGRALFVDEHPLAPTCATCHGSHGAADEQGITAVCGRCHARAREYFNEGPHLAAVGEGRMSECISCHGAHDVSTPSDALFDTRCPQCHGPDSPALAVAQKLKTLLSQAAVSLDTTGSEIEATAMLSPTVVNYRPRLQQARALYLEALPLQHALAVDRVEDLTRRARSLGDEVRAGVHGAQQQVRVRSLMLGAAWLFIVFAVGVAVLRKRELRRLAPPLSPPPDRPQD